MPEMISLRSFRLETTTGHVLQFEANTPKNVPESCVSAAMAAGCVPVDAAAIPFHEDLQRARVEFTGDVRKSMIFLAVKAVAEKNDARQFDGGGTPKTAVIADALGIEVSRKDVASVYQQYLTVTAENREYALHPSAPNILRVIEAESKDELLELVKEFAEEPDVEVKQAKGLTVKDLRKLLLVKFSGVAA